MVWTVPVVLYDGDPLTAAQLNTHVRDNFNASETGVAHAAGRMIVTTGIHSISEVQWSRAYTAGSINIEDKFPTTEDNEGNPLGPSLTVQHNGTLWLIYDARVDMTTGGGNCMYAPVVNGESLGNTSEALRQGAEGFKRGGNFTLWTGEPGIAEVTMAYGVSNTSSTAGYAQRRLTAIPL